MAKKRIEIGYVAYYRASTEDQTLTIEGQRDICNTFSRGLIHTEFVEHESGTMDDRPQLKLALDLCLEKGLVLLVAKLDRLSRKMLFIAQLIHSNVDFIACDMPDANRFTLHIFAAMAEYERDQISIRTKKALEILKGRGIKLGNPQHLTPAARQKGAEVNKYKAINNSHARAARAMVGEMRTKNMALNEMASQLNEAGMRTRLGKKYHPTTVMRVIAQIDALRGGMAGHPQSTVQI